MKKLISTLAFAFVLVSFANAVSVPYWTVSTKENIVSRYGVADIKTNRAAYFNLDIAGLKTFLLTAPLERSGVASLKITLPTPDGKQQDFSVVESPIMEKGLAIRYPEIKTYLVQGITNPAACGRLDVTYLGFHAMILDGDKTFLLIHITGNEQCLPMLL